MDAIKKGRAEGINQVSSALFEKATQGNVTAMIYYLKTRDRENWGENQPEPLKEIPPLIVKTIYLSNALHISYCIYTAFRTRTHKDLIVFPSNIS
jgi:hypothetical protein